MQSAHMVEHVAQVYQKFVLRLPKAQGVLGAVFDLEWVHFLYNTWLFGALVLAYVWWRRTRSPQVPIFLTAAVVIQGWHEIEHIVKMLQYYLLGITVGPKGILGFVVPLVWLHFWYNLIILALVVFSFFAVRALSHKVAHATT
ncbi:MAG: hypothetical protein ACT4P5_19425 [Armatimonadota bacterium]